MKRTPAPPCCPRRVLLSGVAPDMRLVAEIEEELGGVPALLEKFILGGWAVAELVALVHMMLHAAGRTEDYRVLGDQMIAEGLAPYRLAAMAFLRRVVGEQA